MADKLSLRGGSLLIIACLVIISAGLRSAQDLVVPFLLAAFIATMAASPMFWLQKRGLPVACLLYTSPSPRDRTRSRMPSSA